MNDMLTPLDIQNKSFSRSLRGYDPSEVDEFLDALAESIHEYSESLRKTEQEKQMIEDQLKEYSNLKNSLQEALLMAQKSADDKVNAAKEQGEAIIAEARARSEQIIFEANNEREKIRRDIQELKSSRSEIKAGMKSFLSHFEELLSNFSEENFVRSTEKGE